MAAQGTDLVVIERAGVKYKLTLAELVALASGGGGGSVSPGKIHAYKLAGIT